MNADHSWGDSNFCKSENKQYEGSETTETSFLSNGNDNNGKNWGNYNGDNSRGRGNRGRGRRGRGMDRNNNSRGREGSVCNQNERNNSNDNMELPENASEELFIKGINYEATEEDLNDTFSRYGDISSCKILKDKGTQKSKGCGFVKFIDKKSAVQALNDADNLTCKGRNILIRFANDREGEFKGKKNIYGYRKNEESNKEENRGNEENGGRGRERGRNRGGCRGGRVQDNNRRRFDNSTNEKNNDSGWGSNNNRERSRSNDKNNKW